MEKNLSINIAIDNVPLNHLETIQEGIEDLLDKYPDKRITIILQDAPLVRFGQ